jgi:hypothetical protein
MSPISNAIKLAAMNVKSQTHKIDGKTYLFKTKLTAEEAEKRVAEKKAAAAPAPAKSDVERVDEAIKKSDNVGFRNTKDINGTRLVFVSNLPKSDPLYTADINWSQFGYKWNKLGDISIDKAPFGMSFTIEIRGKDIEARLEKLKSSYPNAYKTYMDEYYEHDFKYESIQKMIEKLKGLPEFSTGGYMFPTGAVDKIEEELKRLRCYKEAEHVHKLIRESDTQNDVGKKLTKAYLNKAYKPVISYLKSL